MHQIIVVRPSIMSYLWMFRAPFSHQRLICWGLATKDRETFVEIHTLSILFYFQIFSENLGPPIRNTSFQFRALEHVVCLASFPVAVQAVVGSC